MRTQNEVATFTGVEPYIDITWADTYSNFILLDGMATTDGSAPAYRFTNPSNPALPPTGAAVRVEPAALFSGKIYVLNIEVP